MAYQKDKAYIDIDYYEAGKPLSIMLPHSCDEWVIGNKEEAQDLIDDLTELIEQLTTMDKND